MTIYSVKSTPQGYRMVKFDADLNVEAVYEMRQTRRTVHCPCFRGNGASCRHREMLQLFLAQKAVNTGKFYDYDGKRWLPAVRG
jgi:hypothetical protein